MIPLEFAIPTILEAKLIAIRGIIGRKHLSQLGINVFPATPAFMNTRLPIMNNGSRPALSIHKPAIGLKIAEAANPTLNMTPAVPTLK